MSNIHSQEIAASHNITGLTLECLRWIAAGQPVTTEDLSERFDISEGDLLDLLDSLHDQKLINISPVNQEDAPIRLELTLTTFGLAIVETAAVPPLDLLAPAVAQLPLDEIEKLTEGMRILDRLLLDSESTEPPKESWPVLFGTG
jgi:DNA-binding MarR family transcriptional regulator